IDARLFDIETKIMPDSPALDAYLKDTAGTLFMLAAQILGARDRELETAASQAGIAYGLAGLMRALPIHTAQGRVYLPADELRRHGTSRERVLLRNAGEGLFAVLVELCAKVREALGEARRKVAELDEQSRAAFLPLHLVEPYLATLEKKGRDPLREISDINPLYRLWRLATAAGSARNREARDGRCV